MESQDKLDLEIALLRERLESAEEMRRALIAEELDGFVVGEDADTHRVVLLETSKVPSRMLLERLPHSVVTVSHGGEILYANQRFASVLGRSLVQLFTTPIGSLLASEDQESFKRFLQASSPDSVLDVDLLHADGRCLRLRATAVAVGNGYTSFLMSEFNPLGGVEEAERALQAIHNGEIDGVVVGGEQIMLVAVAHRPYRALVDHMQQGAVTVSLDGDVLYVNEQFASMVGRPRDTLLGKPLQTLLGARAINDSLAAIASRTTPTEFTLTRGDGSHIQVELLAQRVEGMDAVTLILSDLTERDRYKRIQDRAHRNDQFLAVLAHELRNPLGSIRNAVELLRRSTAMGATELRSVELIRRQSTTLARLVDDLLDVHRLHDGTIVLRRKPVDLRGVIAHAVAAVQAKVAAKRQQIEVRLASDSLYVDVDEVRVAQVLGNLLFNACKFTPPGGRIEIVATRTESAAGAIAAHVEVIDTGIGIDGAMIDKIFEPYVQAPRPGGDAVPEGLGLGLSVARRLVELHGGTISARSGGQGCGSVFVFELPLCDAPTRTEESAAQSTEQAGLRILVADDDADSAASLSMLLQLLGHQTYTARNGREALAIAEEFRPQVAILDIGMPDLDGYAAARALREREWGREMVLYALTGWGQAKDRDRTREAGFDRHFVKPIAVDDLTCDLRGRLPFSARSHAA